MKKTLITILVFLGVITSIGYCFKAFSFWPFNSQPDDGAVLTELPFGIEKKNPVPEVKHWNKGQRTLYYFNWGMKLTGGYSLELISVQKNVIKIRASVPQKDQMVIQILTFPHLFLSLPKGNYNYKVFNDQGEPIEGIFKPKNPPLKMTVYLPRDDQFAPREILRDPYLNTDGKTTALIALEALFNQDEMLDFIDHEVLPEGASFSTKEKKWYILLSKGFDYLGDDEKAFLKELISKTILAVKEKSITSLELTTESTKLPPMEN